MELDGEMRKRDWWDPRVLRRHFSHFVLNSEYRSYLWKHWRFYWRSLLSRDLHSLGHDLQFAAPTQDARNTPQMVLPGFDLPANLRAGIQARVAHTAPWYHWIMS